MMLDFLSQLLFLRKWSAENNHIGESEAHSILTEQARCHECARCHRVEASHPFGRGLGEGSGAPVIKTLNVITLRCENVTTDSLRIGLEQTFL